MSDPQLQDRIAQFRKMAQDDPDNELGHFRLGQLLMEDGQVEDAARSFQRTLVLSPAFSKVYLLLAQCQIKLGRRDEAVTTLKEGFKVADQRGDKMPRDDMAKLLTEARSTLANSQYYMTWLMRLEGYGQEVWEPEIEAARQTYKLLAEQAADPKERQRHQEDLEAAVRLARMDLGELQGLPLPSQ